MTDELENGDADWPLRENIKSRKQNGTYLPASEPGDALRVSVNGDGTLGTAGGALVVQPGTGQVQGTKHTVQSSDDRTLDLSLPSGHDRRDAVYLSDAGTLEVREGRGGSLSWGEGVASNARTFRNASRPPPPGLKGVPGLVLAIVTVRSGRGSLDDDAVDSTVRSRPPADEFVDYGTVAGQAMQTSLDGRVVPVSDGTGIVDAVDPTATTSPVQDAFDALSGKGTVLLPPTEVNEGGRVDVPAGGSLRGWSRNPSIIEWDDPANCGLDLAGMRGGVIDDIRLRGPARTEAAGFTTTTQPALSARGGRANNVDMTNLSFDHWVGDGCIFDADDSFSYTVGHWVAHNCDAGGTGNALIHLRQYGALRRWGYVEIYPTDDFSGEDSDIFHLDPFNGTIEHINVGGTTRRVVTHEGESLTIEKINFEPTGKNSATDAVVHSAGGPVWIEDVHGTALSAADAGAATDHAVIVEGAHNGGAIGTVHRPGQFAGAPISVVADANGSIKPGRSLWYGGPFAHVGLGGGLTTAEARRVHVLDEQASGGTKATLSAAFTVPDGTVGSSYTVLPLDTTTFAGPDTLNASGEIVPHRPGVYDISARVAFAQIDNHIQYSARLAVGDTAVAETRNSASGSQPSDAKAHTTARVDAGETIALQATQQSGAGEDVVADAARTYLCVRRVG